MLHQSWNKLYRVWVWLTVVLHKYLNQFQVVDICFELYNETLRMRKKEFHLIVSDILMSETIDINGLAEEVV